MISEAILEYDEVAQELSRQGDLETEGRVAFMHTGFIQEKLPKGKHLVSSGEVLDILE